MLLTVNFVFTILIFLILATFVTIIVITGLYIKKNLPAWTDEFNEKKKEIEKTVDEAKVEIIDEINKDKN